MLRISKLQLFAIKNIFFEGVVMAKVKKFNAKNPSQLPEDKKQEPQNKEKN